MQGIDRSTITRRIRRLRRTTVVPLLAAVALAATWGTKPGTAVLVVIGLLLAGSVLAAVHHAEVVAHRMASPSARSSSPRSTPTASRPRWPRSPRWPF
jgi:hypothetical protein